MNKHDLYYGGKNHSDTHGGSLNALRNILARVDKRFTLNGGGWGRAYRIDSCGKTIATFRKAQEVHSALLLLRGVHEIDHE